MASASYFEAFSYANVIFASVGAAVFWGLNGRTKLRAFVLRDLVDLLSLSENARVATEFIIFVILGTLIGVAVTQPMSATQAITAGFAWTGLFARMDQRKAIKR